MAVLGLTLLLAATILATGASTAAGDLDGVKVCLDPGHGGWEPGAVYVDEDITLYEKEINLDVSYGLKSLLVGKGAEVVMTRSDNDTYLTNEDRYTFCNQEEATILVSVHTNSVTDSTWDGSMTLFAAASRDSSLARAIHEEMYPILAGSVPDGVLEFRDFGVSKFASGVLFKCDMPAAMVEPVFMSHPAEAEALVQTIYKDAETDKLSPKCADFSCRRGQIAAAILDGVLNYFEGDQEPEHPGKRVASP
jgi:N-acetylmuramoyl-L-alanine amidase